MTACDSDDDDDNGEGGENDYFLRPLYDYFTIRPVLSIK